MAFSVSDAPLQVQVLTALVEKRSVEEAVSNVALQRYQSDIMDATIWRLVQKLARIDSPPITFPASWWDALKQAHAPAWFVKRWPVKSVSYHAAWLHPQYPLKGELGPSFPVWRMVAPPA